MLRPAEGDEPTLASPHAAVNPQNGRFGIRVGGPAAPSAGDLSSRALSQLLHRDFVGCFTSTWSQKLSSKSTHRAARAAALR